MYPKNNTIAVVENDILGQIFDLKVFHRCQLEMLIRKHLIEYVPTPDQIIVTAQINHQNQA